MGALDHLWLHFTEMGRYEADEEIQVIVRGDGCYLEDAAGRRYLDALAGLFCVNIGYGFGEEMGEAAAETGAERRSRATTRPITGRTWRMETSVDVGGADSMWRWYWDPGAATRALASLCASPWAWYP